MAILFDGREYAAKKEEGLRSKVLKLKKKGIIPKLVSVLVGDDKASRLYVALKKKAAERIGAKVEVVNLDVSTSIENIKQTIRMFNNDDKFQGIMVQFPLPGKLDERRKEIIDSIIPVKDIDGLRENSPYVHPTVKAVLQIIEVARLCLNPARQARKIAVVGERGMVGGFLIKEITKTKLQLIKETKNADIVVSATGKPGILKGKMVKKGAVVIDIGSPFGDVDPSVALRASFITPVPGGVGPLTISCLLENLIKAAD